MKILKNMTKTERVLSSFIGILTLLITIGLVTPSAFLHNTYADEHSGSSESSDSGSEESTQSNDETSTDSVDEMSSMSEASTPSVDEFSTPSLQEPSEVSLESEMSLDDSDDELSVASEPSVVSVPSTPSVEEESVRSGIDIDNFADGDVIPTGDTTAIVLENERLLFLIPVKVEKRLQLDTDGMVVSVEQSVWSRILDLLSF